MNVILETTEFVAPEFRAFTESRVKFSLKRLLRQDHFIFYKWFYFEFIAPIPTQIHRIEAPSPHLGSFLRLSGQRAR
jgi:hypothetical protein